MPNTTAPDPPRWSVPPWTARQSREQFAAIAWLRWRIAVNALRRRGGAGELVARVLLALIFGSAAFIPTVGAGVAAWYFAANGQLEHIAWVLWGTFLLCQLLNIQLGQPGSTFDPTQLNRFPISLGRYTVIRLGFGLLSPANIVAVLVSLTTAVGVALALPELGWAAMLALAVFASANVLFSRMVFAWVDRWLATRRAREIFSGLVFALSLGIEWLNLSYNPAYRRGHISHPAGAQRLIWIGHVYGRIAPFLHSLPPELTTRSLMAAHSGQMARFAALTLCCALFSAVFLAVFALRMRIEFRGENLSDNANAISPAYPGPLRSAVAAAAVSEAVVTGAGTSGDVGPGVRSSGSAGIRVRLQISPIVSTVFAKEVLYIRRSSGIFYSLVAPVVLVFLFVGKLALNHTASWIFPAALAYTLLGVAPLSYNSFALEGTGSQFYFLAPIHLRDVFLAKNLINFCLAGIESVAVFAIITYLAARPPLQITIAAMLWVAATLLLSTTVGNRRSIAAPKRIKTARAMGRQASPLSGFIAMGVFLASAGLGVALWELADYFHVPWALTPAFAVWFVVGLLVYMRSLRHVEQYAADHREELFTELCKKE